MKRKASIYHLDKYGLNLAGLRKLGARSVTVKADVLYDWHGARALALLRFKPRERHSVINRITQKRANQALRDWPVPGAKIERYRKRASEIHSTLPARLVPRLLRIPQISGVWIQGIQGRKPRKLPPTLEFYAVQARFGIQIEGETKGLQTYEDRILIVKALGEEDAVAKLKRELSGYGEPYLNPHGQLVRWQFEKVLEVYSTYCTEINPKGEEVWSKLRERRLTPQYTWNPGRGKRTSA